MASMKCQNLTMMHDGVQMMDGLSYESFSQISSLCRLALQSMESPLGPSWTEDIAQLLVCIQEVADRTETAINTEAEKLGSQHVDDGLVRRNAARRQDWTPPGSASANAATA